MGKYDSLEPLERIPEFCEVCTTEIKTMCWRGTGVCCLLCWKEKNGEADVTLRAISP